MRLIAILGGAIAVLLAVSVACRGDEDNAHVTPSPASDSEDGVDGADDADGDGEGADEEADGGGGDGDGDGEGADEEADGGDGDGEGADQEPPADDEGGSGFATPEEAVAAFLADFGLGYVGDCEGTSQDTDIGYYCSSLWENRGNTRVYTAGQAFSEANTWLLVALQGVDWTVADTAGFAAGPEGPVSPPWP